MRIDWTQEAWRLFEDDADLMGRRPEQCVAHLPHDREHGCSDYIRLPRQFATDLVNFVDQEGRQRGWFSVPGISVETYVMALELNGYRAVRGQPAIPQKV